MARAIHQKSAGILLFRRRGDGVEVMLAHPGGPFWARKDDGVWTIPKGEFDDEDALAAAKREFFEETGGTITGDAVALSPVKQKSGKLVHAFAVEQDFDPARLTSNTFELEWPPRSGRKATFPEIDRAAWFTPEVARTKLLASQLPLLD
ncbi:MAG TPA: NUDIX domain-containing protein, partial [Polyangia bacterium]|nr:NUDIX domain-containing protein [Polyangia bacterium]